MFTINKLFKDISDFLFVDVNVKKYFYRMITKNLHKTNEWVLQAIRKKLSREYICITSHWKNIEKTKVVQELDKQSLYFNNWIYTLCSLIVR